MNEEMKIWLARRWWRVDFYNFYPGFCDDGLLFIFLRNITNITEFSTFICRIYKLFNAIKKTNLYCICFTTVLVFKLYSDLSLKLNIIPRPLQRHPILEICLLCSSSILPKKLCIDLVMWNNLEVSPSS